MITYMYKTSAQRTTYSLLKRKRKKTTSSIAGPKYYFHLGKGPS